MRRRVLPQSAEEDAAAVGRETVGNFLIGMKGQPRRRAARGGHGVDVEITVALRGKCQRLPVGTPDGVVVVCGVESELARVAARGGNGVEIAPVGKGDGAAVGGDGGVAEPGGVVLSGDRSQYEQEEGGEVVFHAVCFAGGKIHVMSTLVLITGGSPPPQTKKPTHSRQGNTPNFRRCPSIFGQQIGGRGGDTRATARD